MSAKSPITTHVLDTAAGQPARDVGVTLLRCNEQGGWDRLASGRTNGDGRINDLVSANELIIGQYRLVFATDEYFRRRGVVAFYPEVTIDFAVKSESEHYHVPLLLSPFGYSTYRGS